MLAARQGNNNLVTLLLNYDPSIKDISNALELISSIEKVSGIFKSTILTLIKAGANLPENTANILRSLANFEWWAPDHSSVINGSVPKSFSIDKSLIISPLPLAIMCGRQDIVQSYIDANTDIDLNACIQIAHLARRQNLEGYFQGLGANLMAVDKQGMNIIMKAASYGRNDILSRLSSFDINAVQKDGWNALMIAARNGHAEIVTLLLDRGADIHAKDTYGSTALMLDAEKGQNETISILLDRGADIHAMDNADWTPLMIAALNGHNETVSLLLEQGADINAKTNLGNTALMFAAQKGHTETVSLLLGQDKIDIDAVRKDGRTALMCAAKYGHTGTVTTLLERGANIPENKNTLIRTLGKASWWTPMHTAIINNELDLIQRYEYIESYITPLDLAIMIANQYAVLVFIGSEIQYDINDCLRTAIVAKRNGLAIFLLEQGADPTFKDKIGRNSLHTVCYYGDINGIKILVEFSRKKIAAQSIQKCFRSSLFNSRKRKLSSDNECQNAKYIRIV